MARSGVLVAQCSREWSILLGGYRSFLSFADREGLSASGGLHDPSFTVLGVALSSLCLLA